MMNVRNHRAQVGQGPTAIMSPIVRPMSARYSTGRDPRKRMPPIPQGLASVEILM